MASQPGWFCSRCLTRNAADMERCNNSKCALRRAIAGVDLRPDDMHSGGLCKRPRRESSYATLASNGLSDDEELPTQRSVGGRRDFWSPNPRSKPAPNPRRFSSQPPLSEPAWRKPPTAIQIEAVVASEGEGSDVLDPDMEIVEARTACQPIPAHVQAAADAEGLSLVHAPGTETGFKGVYCRRQHGQSAATEGAILYFEVKVWGRRARKMYFLGEHFATAAEAALGYARHLGPMESSRQANASIRPGTAAQAEGTDAATFAPAMTREQVMAAAEREGLTITPDRRYANGFRGVSEVRSRRKDGSRNFIAKAYHPYRYLGVHASPEEAALAIARHEQARAAV